MRALYGIRFLRWPIGLLAMLALAPAGVAQYYPPPPPPGAVETSAIFSQQELDQMLAPIALYADALLSQILMAATYPSQLAAAARWSQGHPGLSGEEAVRAAAAYDWEPAVTSLVAFPQVLAMMAEKFDWTQRLGNAFLEQEPLVMDTVQELRHRAYAAGTLRTTDQVHVMFRDSSILLVPASPQVVYVPHYDPVIAYGTWWWPTHQPVHWSPWAGYQRHSGGFAWGRGVQVRSGFFFGDFDWRERRARIAPAPSFYRYRTNVQSAGRESNVWRDYRAQRPDTSRWTDVPRERRSGADAAGNRPQFNRSDGFRGRGVPAAAVPRAEPAPQAPAARLAPAPTDAAPASRSELARQAPAAPAAPVPAPTISAPVPAPSAQPAGRERRNMPIERVEASAPRASAVAGPQIERRSEAPSVGQPSWRERRNAPFERVEASGPRPSAVAGPQFERRSEGASRGSPRGRGDDGPRGLERRESRGDSPRPNVGAPVVR